VYEVARLRIKERDSLAKIDRTRPAEFYTDLPGVEAVSLAARFYVPNAGQDGRQPVSGEILAVNAETFAGVSFWRDDLGARVLPPLPETVVSPGRVLPVIPDRIGLWALVEQPQANDTDGAPLLDDAGNVFEQLYHLNTPEITMYVTRQTQRCQYR
jgi:hypothetical protein